jgi:hypothetical protein
VEAERTRARRYYDLTINPASTIQREELQRAEAERRGIQKELK